MAHFQGEAKYRDEPNLQGDDAEMHDVHDITLGNDGGGGRTNYDESKVRRKWYKRPVIWASFALVLVLVGIVGAAMALFGGSDDKNTEPAVGVNLPPPNLPPETVEANKATFTDILSAKYNEKGMDFAPLSDTESFQSRALTWVAGNTVYGELSEAQNIERYAAVVFYLSTYRQPHLLLADLTPWLNNAGWATGSNVCDWTGIECNGDGRIVGMLLPENDLTGTLPNELGLFDFLETIDFSSNLIYMDEDNHGTWTFLTSLKELIMDDNYVLSESGIPLEFAGMESIEKISLSFNLLQGSFDEEVFLSMPTLIHFEAESNYIRGELPSSLLTMPNLTYIYLRRNSLTQALGDIFLSGNLPSLFAIWLDGNAITGQIPSTIGEFTGIASMSITDAGLTGPLPTEMANLVELQRLWLYNNELSGPIPPSAAAAWTKLEVMEVYGNQLQGQMPQAICTVIQASTYEFKSLAADCQELKCEEPSCCTTCY